MRGKNVRQQTCCNLKPGLVILLILIVLALGGQSGPAAAFALAQDNNLIQNGGFETGDLTGWGTSGSPWVGTTVAYEGLYSARLGADNDRDDTIYQEVTLPSDAQWIWLSYYRYIYSQEGTTNPYDYLYVEIQDTSGAVLETLEVVDNTYPREQWLMSSLSLKDYPALLGQTVRIAFHATTDYSLWTSFYIDQVELYYGVNVVVEDEGGSPLPGARVYHDDTYVGETGYDGGIAVTGVQLGDHLSALDEVYQRPSKKDYHDLAGIGDWSWRAYQTSVNIDVNSGGTPQLHTVTDVNQVQVLTIRKNQALLGMHMVVSVEWDASNTYLADLRQGLQSASAYLYDVTDGQFYWEVIEVFDNRERWADCDMRIYASNQVWPSSAVWGIIHGKDKRILMGRFFNGATANTGPWKNSNGYRTMIHEFGHYGLGLWDEYLDRNHKKTADAYCATNFSTTPQAERSSIMSYQFTSSELCSDLDPDHLHRTQTEHDAMTGGSTWETVLLLYEDKDTPARWTLLSPVERNAIVPGPDAIPVAGWSQVYVTDASTAGLCAPFTQSVSDGTNPVEKAELWLDRPGTLPDIKQGLTDKNGQIVIYGAHTGDTLRARKGGASASMVLNCPSGRSLLQDLAVQADPFGVEITAVPVNTYTLDVQVAATVGLLYDPVVELWQSGADAPIYVAVDYVPGPGHYAGQAILDTTLESAGDIVVAATDGGNQTVQRRVSFAIQDVPAGENIRLFPGETFEIVFPAGSLSADTALLAQQATAVQPPPEGLVQVSDAYQVFVSSGQYDLNVAASVHMRYHAEQAATARVDDLQIYRWDEGAGQWVSQGGSVDQAFSLVSTDDVGQLGTFAVFGQPASRFYLPIVVKSY